MRLKVSRQTLRRIEYKKPQNYLFKCPDCSNLFLKLGELLVHRQQSHASPSQDPNETATMKTIRVEIFESPTTSPYPKSMDNGDGEFPHYTTIEVIDEVFVCPVECCKLACYSKKLLDEHSNLHGEFKCHSCDIVMSFAPDLALHELTHGPKKVKQSGQRRILNGYSCLRCDFKCSIARIYIRHVLTDHFSITSSHVEVECAICKIRNKNIGGLDKNATFKHYKKIHDVRERRKMMGCNVPNCPSYFLYPAQKGLHQQIYHGNHKKEKWKCLKCSKTFDSSNELNAHKQDAEKCKAKPPNYVYKTEYFSFKCSECSDTFRYIHELLLHRENAHSSLSENLSTELVSTNARKLEVDVVDDTDKEKILLRIEVSEKVYICPVDNCSDRFYKKKDLEHHRQYFHGKFKCDFCEIVTSSAANLAEHEIEHAPGGTFDCARCKVHFNLKDKFLYHHVTAHLKMDVVNYNCPVCSWSPCRNQKYNPREIYRRSALYNHLIINHDIYNCSKDSIVRCTMENCDAYFINNILLDSHMRNWHKLSEREMWCCHLCGKRFKSRNNLHNHQVKLHAKELKLDHKCPRPNCREAFADENSLQSHISSYHESKFSKLPKVFKCSICGKCYAAKSNLVLHVKAHSYKPERRFECELCGKIFKGRETLRIHERVHAGPQSWEHCCDICGKRVSSKGNLKLHTLIHTNENMRYVCQVCGAKYSTRQHLRVHINSKHGDIMQEVARKYDATNSKRKVKSGESSTTALQNKQMKRSGRPKKINTEMEEEEAVDSDSSNDDDDK